MTSHKLKKIVINKIGDYHGEIKLKDCTLINCVNLSAREINDFAMILKFILTDEDTPVDELVVDYAENPFVAVHIQSADMDTVVMTKSLLMNSIAYEIDGLGTTAEDFATKQREYGCILSYSWFLTQKTITSCMNLTDKDRLDLIEDACDNRLLKMEYNHLNVKTTELETGMKYLNEHKKELFMEKKLEKTRLDNATKVKKAVKDYQNQFDQITLAKVYFNNQKSFRAESILEDLCRQGRQLRDKYQEDYVSFKDNLKIYAQTDIKLFFEKSLQNDSLINYKRLHACLQSDISSSTNQQILRDTAQREQKLLDEDCNKIIKSLENIQKIHSQQSKSDSEYQKLEDGFCRQHDDATLFYMLESYLDKSEKITKKQLDIYKTCIETIRSESAIYVEHLVQMTQMKVKIANDVMVLNENVAKLSKEQHEIGRAIEEYKCITDKSMKYEHNSLQYIKLIEQHLRDKYPQKIVGILSELFDVREIDGLPLRKSTVLDLLGCHVHSIIVNDLEARGELFIYLRMLNLVNVNLQPQGLYQAPPSLRSLRSKALPNIKLVSIEDFLYTVSEEVKDILMHFLGQTVVCDCKTVEDAQKIFESLGKTVTVVTSNFVISIATSKQFGKSTDPNTVDMNEAVNRLKELKNKSVSLNVDIEGEKSKFYAEQTKLENLEFLVNFMKIMIDQNQKCAEVMDKKINTFERQQTEGENENFVKIKTVYKQLEENLQPLMDAHFQNFCQKHRIQSILGHRKSLKLISSHQKSMEALTLTIDLLNKAKGNIENLIPGKTDWTKKQAELNKIIDKISKIESEMEVSQNKQHEIWTSLIHKVVDCKNNYDEITKEMQKNRLNLADACSVSILMTLQNYKLIESAVLEYKTISLNGGSMTSFFKMPEVDDDDDDFNIFEERTKELDFNFNLLDDNIINTADTEGVIGEMEGKLEDLQMILKENPIDHGTQKTDLIYLNERIKELKTELMDTNSKCQEYRLLFKSVTNERKKRFLEALEIINQEIESYCEVTSDGRNYGKLMPMNEREPFLEGIRYLWKAHNGPSQCIDNSQRNWRAALAFYLGILSYKQQRVLTYIEVSGDLQILDALVKYSSSNETNFQAIVLWKSGIDDTICDSCIMRCNDKLHIIDNEEMEHEIEHQII